MNYKLKILSGCLATFSSLAFAADSGINTSSLKLKVYKVGISTDPLCTNPVTVFEASDADATYSDFLNSPTLGSGSVDVGTYPCVMIEMSDRIKYKPAETSTSMNCVGGVEQTLDVCGGHGADSAELVDGTAVSCDASENRVAMFLSTASALTNGTSGHSAFQRPTQMADSAHGFKLNGALEVGASSSARFIVNADGQVEDDGSACEMMPPLFSFAQ